jgi:hypothetical protein
MPTQQDSKPDDPQELRRQERAACKKRIGERVIKALGHSDHFRTVQVRSLWGQHYRVNVFIGADAASAKIAHSYFVEVDLEGNIIESTPKIDVQAGST